MKRIHGLMFFLMCGMALWPLACGKNLSPTTASEPTPTPPPDWTIGGSVTVNAGSYDYGNIHIMNGGILNLMGPSGAVTGAAVTLNLTGDLVMDAGASVVGNGTGYASAQGPGAGGVSFANIGGGGHGGAGGIGGVAAAGPANDNSADPALMGSGGGAVGGGGSGGALLRINATSASLYGSIQVNGNGTIAGGGAGGTIYIQANTIFGNGDLEAAGGSSITPNTGGGGGGIIVLSVHSGYYFTGTFNVSGAPGVGTNSTGGNGFFVQTGF